MVGDARRISAPVPGRKAATANDDAHLGERLDHDLGVVVDQLAASTDPLQRQGRSGEAGSTMSKIGTSASAATWRKHGATPSSGRGRHASGLRRFWSRGHLRYTRMVGPGSRRAPIRRRYSVQRETGTFRVKRGLAEMLAGGVIMDVVDPSRPRSPRTPAPSR